MRFILARALTAMLLAVVTTLAAACPEQVPPRMTAAAVGEELVVNGLPVSILFVQGRDSVATVFAQLEKTWRDAGYDVRRNAVSGWNVLSALSDKCLTTLQLQDHSGSAGYLAVQRRKPPKRGAHYARLPLPRAATVLSTVDSNDSGRKATTMALTTPDTLQAVHEFFERSLREDHWGAVQTHVAMSDKNMVPQALVVSAQRGHERIDVALWRDGQTQILINVGAAL
jgi:hypothetical protein